MKTSMVERDAEVGHDDGRTTSPFGDQSAQMPLSGIPGRVPRRSYTYDAFDPLHILRALEEMFELQRERIQLEIRTERSLKKLFPATSREFATLTRLGATIFELKLEFGILQVSSERCPRIVVNEHAPPYMQVFANAESRHRVLEVVEMLMDEELMDDVVANPARYRGLFSEKKTTKPISCR